MTPTTHPTTTSQTTPLWHKGTAAADWVTRFTVGDDWRWDGLLLPYDARATAAHAWGLVRAGVLTEAELRAVDAALDDLLAAAAAGEVTVAPSDEDCHTVIERWLTDRLGEVGKKIHTGRSRNDQVLAALRLFLRERLAEAGRLTADVAEALCGIGEAHGDVMMPGYTHMQRAMPSTVGLWALGYAELLAADLDGLRAAHEQVNVCPLGSAAGYGVPHLALPVDAVAERLGFRAVQRHATAVQLSRGKLEMHVVHALVQVAATLGRLASDLVLFATAEYGFVRLPAEHCTGSSIMPQKKNPDVPELVRASYHRLTAELHLLATLPAGLASGYHRDLQLTKEAAMRAAVLGCDVLSAMASLLPGLRFDAGRLRAAVTPGLFATAHALRQVQSGVPFRDAYRATADALPTLAVPADALSAYTTPGSPGHGQPHAVREALASHAGWTAG